MRQQDPAEQDGSADDDREGVRIVERADANLSLQSGKVLRREVLRQLAEERERSTTASPPPATRAPADAAVTPAADGPPLRPARRPGPRLTFERGEAVLDLTDATLEGRPPGASEHAPGSVSHDDRSAAPLPSSTAVPDGPISAERPMVIDPAGDAGQLQHWTEPPTGEVPAVLDTAPADAVLTPSWRGGRATPSLDDTLVLDHLQEASGLAAAPLQDDVARGTAGEGVREQMKGRKRVRKSSERGAKPPTSAKGPAGGDHGEQRAAGIDRLRSASFAQRVITGALTGGVALVAFAGGPTWTFALAFLVMFAAAMEFYDGVRRVGYRPATLLGLLSVAGLMAGTYARGEGAIALVVALAVIFTFLWYLTGIIREAPTSNIAVTLLGVLWVGVLGSYAALLLAAPHRHGIAFLLGAVLCTAAYDSFAYIGGNLFGKHLLARSVSPKKTWEGTIVGTIGAVIVGGGIVALVHPWTLGGAIALALVVAVVAPIGDLAESLIKRDLGIKDMSNVLPGHGGIFDRFDALLFVLPATYYLVRLLGLA